jgi:hypothetical protein
MAQQTNASTYRKSVPVLFNATNPTRPGIPIPQLITSGTATAGSGGGLVFDTSKDFIALGVKVGDLVVNTTSGIPGAVTAVNSATQITIQVAGVNPSTPYIIYQGNNQAGLSGTPWDGAVIFNARVSAAPVQIKTVDGVAINVTIPANSVCPIQVSDVTSNSNSYNDLWALWP